MLNAARLSPTWKLSSPTAAQTLTPYWQFHRWGCLEDCGVLNGICYYQALLPGWRRFAQFLLGLEVSSKTLKENEVLISLFFWRISNRVWLWYCFRMSILLSLQELLMGKEGGYLLFCVFLGAQKDWDGFFSGITQWAHKAIELLVGRIKQSGSASLHWQSWMPLFFLIGDCSTGTNCAYVVNAPFSVLAMGQNKSSSYHLYPFSWTYGTTYKQAIVR